MNRFSFSSVSSLLASALAVLLTGLAVAYLLASETPRGRVTGVITLGDAHGKPAAKCRVSLNPHNDERSYSLREIRALRQNDAREGQEVLTDERGRFTFTGVPTGEYILYARTKRHDSGSLTVAVEESKTWTENLALTRTEPDLRVADHQTDFGTDEKPFLPIRGYLPDPTKEGEKPTMRVRLWRTRLSAVLQSPAASAMWTQLMERRRDEPISELSKAGLSGASAVPVADAVIPITKDDSEGFFVERVPLTAATAKPGLYFAQFVVGAKSVCAYVVVSDLALVAKRGHGQIFCYAAKMKAGTPVPGATMTLYGDKIAKATTSADGVASFTMPKKIGSESADAVPMVVASLGDDEAVVRRVRFYGGEGVTQYAASTVTDRTIYRPGDTVEYKTIVRRKRESGDGYDVPRNLPVAVEIRDPSGLLVTRETKTTNPSGAYWGNFALNSEGATGEYIVRAKIGEENFEEYVSVASYRKPEFTVTITPETPRCIRGEKVKMNVAATYYFGSPVAGAKIRYAIHRDADWRAEYGASEYDSDEQGNEGGSYRNYYGEEVATGEAVLDSAGKAVILVDTGRRFTDERQKEIDAESERKPDSDRNYVPQSETYTLTATVEESSERSVSGDGAVSVRSAETLVRVTPEGYVAEPGKPSGVFVNAVGPEGKPAVGVSVSLSAAYTRWDAKAKKDIIEPLGAAQTATTGADGRAYFSVTPTHGGEIKLTASARDSLGRLAQSEDGLWASGDGGGDLRTDYGDLTVLTDKNGYKPGETARVLLNSSRTGQTILLCAEGERVYQSWSVPMTNRSVTFRIPIRAEWGGNVTLTACYVRDKHFASTETPLRVKILARELNVAVTPVGGDKYGPGQDVTYAIEIRDAATGKPTPAALSLAVADESLFALEPDTPKDLRNAFYPRRFNQVNTSYSFSVEYLSGADKEGASPKIAARRRFRDTAAWFPEIQTDASGKANVTVTLPDNLTTWRATAKAISATTAVGYAASKIVTSKPFFVRLETPRFLTGGDSSRLRTMIHNETGQTQNVTVRMEAANLLPPGASDKQTLSVANGEVKAIDWPISAPPTASGPTPLRVTAWTEAPSPAKAQFTDGVEQNLPLRAYGATEFTTFAADVVPGGESSPRPADATPLTATPDRLTLVLDKNAVPAETRLTVRLTPSVRGALTSGMEYLIGFPYGCTEQTMSRFYPDLLAKRLGVTLSKQQTADLPRMARDGVSRLAVLQHESGAWGWWEHDHDNAFLTAYALVGLAEARSQGFDTGDMLERGTKAAEKMIDKAEPRDRPFLLYALASAGSNAPQLKNAFRYSAIRTGLDPQKLPPPALAYMTLLGQKVGANYKPFWDEFQRRAVVQGRVIHWNGSAKNVYDSHASDRMATALGLRCLLALDPKDTRVASVLRYLMQSRTDSYFGDTRDTAWVLTALADYLKAFPDDGKTGGAVTLRINDKAVKTISLDTTEPEIVIALPARDLRPGSNTLQIARDSGKGTLFFAGSLRQTIAAPSVEKLTANPGDNIAIERKFLRIAPKQDAKNPWNVLTVPATDGKFTQGEPFRVRLVITAKKAADYLLIEDTFPSGAEVTERGTADVEWTDSRSLPYDHMDVRDDRVAFFVTHLEPGVNTLEYNLRAQTPGVCRALPAQLQAMYDSAVRASSAGAEITVGKK